VNLRQLHYFSVLAETSNFHRAAEKLNIAQPPLTVAIRKLEQELGVPLFIRTPRGVTLTPAGEVALSAARETLAQAELVRKAVRQSEAGDLGALAIGFVGSATSALLPRLIQSFRERYPKVELVLAEGTSIDISQRIEDGSLDVGLVRLPLRNSGRIVTHVVERDRMVAALPADHRLCRRARLQLADMANEPFLVHTPVSILRTTALAACQAAGFIPRIAQEATQVQTILCLVQSGLGVALVPSHSRRFLPSGVVLKALSEKIDIAMGLAHGPQTSPIVRNLIAMVESFSDTE
jgi:DNA-binding transcriptional LysR family regulator